MKRPRVSVANLMVLVLLVACGFGVVRYVTKENHFAVIGPIDINRDGKDDHVEFRRMIENAGGVVDFDVPPPEAGNPTGRISERINWYICDDRTCCRDPNFDWTILDQESIRRLQLREAFDKRTRQYIKALRLAGARPIAGRILLDWSEKEETVAP